MNAFRALRQVRVSRLQAKLLAIVGFAMAVAVAVAIAALTRVYGAAKDVERTSRQDFEIELAIVRAESALRMQTLQWQRVLLHAADPAMRDAQWEAFTEAEKAVRGFAKDSRAATPDAELGASLDAFLASHAAAGAEYRRAYGALRKGAAAGDLEREGVAAARASASLDEAEAIARRQGARVIEATVASGRHAYEVAIAATVAAMLAALIAVAFYTRRALLAPISIAASHAERIARGDLTARIEAGSRDEAGQLLAAFARMNEGLAQVVTQVRAAAEAVVGASGEVAAGMTDLSQRTEEQASSLEETAASMEELSSTVRQNADNAREADELASNASHRAEQGGREVAQVIVTMDGISQSAKRIADIISVIDGIAFQTNILALNAAVEAARAGEQGRGFAVVASEVRSLAQRSAQAAKEIKELIGDSVARVDEGTQLVDKAGETIAALVSDVKKVSGLMGSIAEASAEQSRGVQQVGKTVTEMDKVVQQNASAVQRSASAADGMRRQADALLRAVGAFRVGKERAAREARAPQGRDAPAPIVAMPARAGAPGAHATAAATAASDEWKEF